MSSGTSSIQQLSNVSEKVVNKVVEKAVKKTGNVLKNTAKIAKKTAKIARNVIKEMSSSSSHHTSVLTPSFTDNTVVEKTNKYIDIIKKFTTHPKFKWVLITI